MTLTRMTLAQLIERDDVETHWFWTHSVSTGPYEQYEVYDGLFVRRTDEIAVSGGSTQATLYVRGISESTANGMNKHGGTLITPSPMEALASVICDAHEAAQYTSFRAWALDVRDHSAGYRAAIDDYDDWEILRARHTEIARWLDGEGSDTYDAYVQAAQQYAADH